MKKGIIATVLFVVMMQANAATTIRFSHVVANDTPKGQTALKFKELLEQRSNGEFVVEVYPESQLYDDKKAFTELLLGNVQIVAPSLSKFGSLTDKFQVFDLPFLFKDMDAVQCFQDSPVGQKLLQENERNGLIGLGYVHNGLKQFSADQPIYMPQDMSKKKFRIMSSDVLDAQYKSVQAIPVQKPFSEVFGLLKSKRIDGQESTWSNIYSQKFHEVQPYITVSNHGLLDYMVVTSESFWSSLSADNKKLVKQAMDDAIAYGNRLASEINDRSRRAVEQSGYSQVIELSDEERQQWIDAMQPVWRKFESKIGADVIAAAQHCNS